MAAKNDLIVRLLLDGAQFEGGVRNASKELMRMRENTRKATDFLDGLTGGLVKSATKFASWGAAATVASKLITDSFMSAEQAADDLRRVQEECKNAYTAFVATIESSSWSGFFSRMSAAVENARELYDAFDRLGSIRQNDSPVVARQRALVNELREQINDTGIDVDTRKQLQEQLKEASNKLTSLQDKEAKAGLAAGLKAVEQSLINRGVGATEAKKIAKTILDRGQDYYDEVDKQIAELSKGQKTVQIVGAMGTAPLTTTLSQLSAVEQERLKLLQAVKQGESDEVRQLGIQTYKDAYNLQSEIALQEMRTNRAAQKKLSSGVSGVGGSSASAAAESVEVGSLNYIAIRVAELKRARGNTLDASKQQAIDAEISELVAQRIRLNFGVQEVSAISAQTTPNNFVDVSGVDLSAKLDSMREGAAVMAELRKELEADALASSVYGLEDAFVSLGTAIGGLPGEMTAFLATSATAVARLVSENAQLLAAAQAVALGGAAKNAFQLPFPFNIAMWASLSATVLGIFASLPKFVGGGIVEGLSGGDRNLARVNAGEMILNNAQQRRLFSLLDGRTSMQGGEVKFKIEGDALVGVIENINRKNKMRL